MLAFSLGIVCFFVLALICVDWPFIANLYHKFSQASSVVALFVGKPREAWSLALVAIYAGAGHMKRSGIPTEHLLIYREQDSMECGMASRQESLS